MKNLTYNQTGDLEMGSKGQLPLDFFESVGIEMAGHQMCSSLNCFPGLQKRVLQHVWCLSVSYFVYLVSVDPDIGEIDGK